MSPFVVSGIGANGSRMQRVRDKSFLVLYSTECERLSKSLVDLKMPEKLEVPEPVFNVVGGL